MNVNRHQNGTDGGGNRELSLPIALLGSLQLDLENVPAIVEESGFKVRAHGVVRDGDGVLFCVSCADGPTQGTRESLVQCSGLRIRPLAIVMTKFALVDDESLHGLLETEQRDLLTRILPSEIIDEMPVLISGDPYLPAKLRDLVAAHSMDVLCNEIDV